MDLYEDYEAELEGRDERAQELADQRVDAARDYPDDPPIRRRRAYRPPRPSLPPGLSESDFG